MNSAPIRHQTIPVNGIAMHVAALGEGPPLVLLHGWPEFWLTWEPVMRRLADRFTLIAPDLRGFGASATPDARPSDQAGAAAHAADIVALMDALGVAKAGIVAHDVGAYVVQALGRSDPERARSPCSSSIAPIPAIGPRAAEPGHLKEIWYQSFHQTPFAPPRWSGATRETCATYIGHFLRHWAGRPDAFDEVMPLFVDNFLRPGVLQGGFNWYISANESRLATMRGKAPPQPRISVPTCVRWGDRSPLMPYAWTDRLGETFADLDLAPIPCGHFPHREDPDRAAAEISRFFSAR